MKSTIADRFPGIHFDKKNTWLYLDNKNYLTYFLTILFFFYSYGIYSDWDGIKTRTQFAKHIPIIFPIAILVSSHLN